MHTRIEDYRTQRGSDLQRDGMYLELVYAATGDEVAEVFYDDKTKKMQVSLFASTLPLEAVEYLLERAKEVLPEKRTE